MIFLDLEVQCQKAGISLGVRVKTTVPAWVVMELHGRRAHEKREWPWEVYWTSLWGWSVWKFPSTHPQREDEVVLIKLKEDDCGLGEASEGTYTQTFSDGCALHVFALSLPGLQSPWPLVWACPGRGSWESKPPLILQNVWEAPGTKLLPLPFFPDFQLLKRDRNIWTIWSNEIWKLALFVKQNFWISFIEEASLLDKWQKFAQL